MNLGGFAGGLAQGFQQGRQFNLERDRAETEKDLGNRRMKLAEDQGDREKTLFDQQQEYQEALKQEKENSYGPKQVEDGYTESASPDGTVVRTPKYRMEPAKQFGQDVATDAQFLKRASMLQFLHKGNAQELAPVMKAAQDMMNTEEGKQAYAAMSGDKNALSAIVTKLGGDPDKAAFSAKDPTKLDLGNGKTIDMRNYFGMAGLFDMSQHLNQNKQSDATVEHLGAATTNLGAQSDEARAKTNVLIPAEAAAQYGAANQHNAYAARAKTLATDAQSAKAEAGLGKMVNPYVQNGADGKPDPVQRAFIHGTASQLMSEGTVKDGQKAAFQASQLWNQKSKAADGFIATLDMKDKAGLKARFGTSVPSAIKTKIMAGYAQQVGAPRQTTAPGADPIIDNQPQ